jgi:16S rRNA (cytosine967-C5)-methyltransferase
MLDKQMNGRQAAFWLLKKAGEGAYINLELSQLLSQRQIADQDRGFATELTYGCLKQQAWLDFFLQKWLTRPLEQLDRPVLIALRLGLYQIHFMDRIPAHAAVSETVELIKEDAPYATGLVNAVLHKALAQEDWTVRSKKGKAGWLAITYSHPLWMIHRWVKRFGEEETEELLRSNQRTPQTYLRVNTLKILAEDLWKSLQERQVPVRKSELLSECFLLDGPVQNVEEDLGRGFVVIQDIGAMMIARVLNPQPGEMILDYCSAPGGKATHLAALMSNQGKVVALELHDHRVELIKRLANRTGATMIQTIQHDGTKPFGQPNSFDRILLDAPCSGTGVLGRKIDARWQKTYEQLAELTGLQQALLKQAYACLKPGGTLVYSTCSLEWEENEKNLQWFLSEEPTATLESFKLPMPEETLIPEGFYTLLPQKLGGDGFFIAKIRKEK